ncbi:MAG: aminoacyl-tRNA hydrolase [Nitrospinae bacterium]|nr:aminoacyl-tRNA hydrolase [Nitrospinota bacterium]
MKLVAGLGNPGPDYERTRHNAGFMALDVLLRRHGLSGGKVKNEAFNLTADINGRQCLLVKPLSYMNLSGRPIRAFMDFYKMPPEDLLVIHDDIDISLGDVRYKTGGGHGGHNGLKSIMAELGTAEFHRVRIGVNRPPAGWDASNHVLSPFLAEEAEAVKEALEKAAELIEKKFLG